MRKRSCKQPVMSAALLPKPERECLVSAWHQAHDARPLRFIRQAAQAHVSKQKPFHGMWATSTESERTALQPQSFNWGHELVNSTGVDTCASPWATSAPANQEGQLQYSAELARIAAHKSMPQLVSLGRSPSSWL